jgi:hypothetical protein
MTAATFQATSKPYSAERPRETDGPAALPGSNVRHINSLIHARTSRMFPESSAKSFPLRPRARIKAVHSSPRAMYFLPDGGEAIYSLIHPVIGSLNQFF